MNELKEIYECECEKVYQVRIQAEEYDDFVEDDNGNWEFETEAEAFAVFNKYKKEDDEKVIITRTPKLAEDECEDAGIEYELEYIAEK